MKLNEGSRDTENWSNGFWKFIVAITEINDILIYIKIVKINFLNCNNVWHNDCFTVFFYFIK